MKLMREVRYAQRNRRTPDPRGPQPPPTWTFRIIAEGPLDPKTGYVCDIKALDAVVREQVAPVLLQHHNPAGQDPHNGFQALPRAFAQAARACPSPASLSRLEFRPSPFLLCAVERHDPTMVYLTKIFEFCAAHRLFCSDFTDEQNRAVFGPCSNPNWHGHNYRLEVTVAARSTATTRTGLEQPAFERIVYDRVLNRFDHKNLNLECEDFAELNPSVENIAHVIWNRLEGAFHPAELARVRVWETSKTYAEYAGPTD